MQFIYKIKSIIVLCLISVIIPDSLVLADCIKYDQKDIVVGLLSTKFPTYPNEDKTAAEITQLLQSYRVRVVLMDYNVLMESVKDEIIKRNKSYVGQNYQVSRYSIIEDVVEEFIKNNRINRILIPGNYYNISSFPISPSLDRQLVTNAIVQIVNKNNCIHLFGICGGFQGIMDANGVKIRPVDSMLNSEISVASHRISMPNPRNVDANLHKIIVFSHNRLSGILNYLNDELNKSTQVIYLPDAHSEAVDNSIENIKKIYSLGYKIVALSEDGIIEAIEDKYGNIYVQFHPEYLLVNVEKKRLNNVGMDTSIMIADAIIRDFLFRD
ncbi:gamma-glutamyl-gamma-aminobutyrate hydrolase family protein [Ehrlichia ruminantium]|uniref:glutamine amidotransferase-related protein n=1 Tax=Ehrlichia ruminantium TaxID=779 RepID=UPI001FB38DB8|nr:gamma-glutamyl-gamma-aminobutyrate hydrolase family protein [Ehrlichia ruminantium]UOD98434.1 gamma-glutamyl-gamma-aminobutyrate hydrolase family protein [Ehrlichia ruminantium]